MTMRGRPTSSGSSSEEDDPNWKAAIESIASTTTFVGKIFGTISNGSTSHSTSNRDDDEKPHNSLKLKHYQLKAQKLLDDILENTLEIVSEPNHVTVDPVVENGGVRLFKDSPAGIVFDHVDEIQGPKKRPRIVAGYNINEKPKEFRRRTKSITVDGVDIIASAREAGKKATARLEAKEAAAQAKAKREEERVAELKRMRGERWLPSIAKEIQSHRKDKQQV